MNKIKQFLIWGAKTKIKFFKWGLKIDTICVNWIVRTCERFIKWLS